MAKGKYEMKSNVNSAWETFSDLMRNFPLWPSTFSTCVCGREPGRGGGKCAKCLEEELSEKVGPVLANEAVMALRNVKYVWEKIRKASDNG